MEGQSVHMDGRPALDAQPEPGERQSDEQSFKTVHRSKGHRGKRLADIQDESWQLVSKEPPRCKRAVIFVGNLSASCTEDSLKKFVTCRSSAVGRKIDAHNCSLHVSKEEKVSARVCVDADAMPTIMSENFWPRPLYARSWKFAKRDETGRDHDGTGEKDSATGDAGFSVTPHGKSHGFEHSSPPGMHTAKRCDVQPTKPGDSDSKSIESS